MPTNYRIIAAGMVRGVTRFAILCVLAAAGLFAQCTLVTSGAMSQQAANCLQTSGNVTVTAGPAVSFQSGTAIYLTPGFTAQAGSSFVASIGAVQPLPTVTLTDNTQSSGYYFAGDSFTVTVTGPTSPANLPVTISFNGECGGMLGQIYSNGIFSYSNSWTAANIGHYTETWCVNGVEAVPAGSQAPGPLSFSVLPAPTISGQVTGGGAGISGITVAATSGGTQVASAVTDVNGNYSLTLSGGVSYLIAALETDSWVFSPASIAFNILSAPGTAFFIGTKKYKISGNVGLSASSTNIAFGGFVVSLNGYQIKTATTDDNGNYSFNVPSGQSYTVSAPTFPFTFSAPVSFSSLAANQTANFVTDYTQCHVSPPVEDVAGPPWVPGSQAQPNTIQVNLSGFPAFFTGNPTSNVIGVVMHNWNAVLAYSFPCLGVGFAASPGAPGTGSFINMQFVAIPPAPGSTLTRRGLTNFANNSAGYNANGQLTSVSSMQIQNQITTPAALAEVVAHEFGHTFGLGDCDTTKIAICVLHSTTMVINAVDPNSQTINQLVGLPTPTACDMGTLGGFAGYSCPQALIRPKGGGWADGAIAAWRADLPSSERRGAADESSGDAMPLSPAALVGFRMRGDRKIWSRQRSTLVVLGPERCPDNTLMALDYIRRVVSDLAGDWAEEFTHRAARSAAHEKGVRLGGVIGASSLGLHLPSGPGLLLVDRRGRIQNAWIGSIPMDRFQEVTSAVRKASRNSSDVYYMEQGAGQ